MRPDFANRLPALQRLFQNFSTLDRAILIFWFAYLFANLGTGVWSLVLNLYLLEHGFGPDLIGAVTSFSTFGSAAAAIPASKLMNRLDERSSLMLVGLILGIAYCAQALWPMPVPELVFSFVGGGALSLLAVAMVPFLSTRVPREERSGVFAATFVVQAAALMIGSLLGGYVPGIVAGLFPDGYRAATGFAVALFIGGICSLFSLIPFSRLSQGRRSQISRPRIVAPSSLGQHTVETRDPFNGWGSLIFAGVGGLMATAYGLTGPFFNVYLSTELHAPASVIGAIFFAASLAGIPAAMVGPTLVRYLGSEAAVAVSRFAGAPLLGLIPLLPSTWVVGSAFIFRNISASMAWPVELAFWTDRLPAREQARGIAFRTTATNLTWGIAGMVGGQVILRVGYAPIFVTSSILLTIVALIYLFAFRRREAVAAAPTAG